MSQDAKEKESTTETYDYRGLFGNLHVYEEYKDYAENIQPFTNMNDLLKSVKILGIEDILSSFSFGDSIKIPHELNAESKAELLNEYWIPTLLYDSGLCYIFEPKQHGLDKIPVIVGHSTSTILGIEMSFNVKHIS